MFHRVFTMFCCHKQQSMLYFCNSTRSRQFHISSLLKNKFHLPPLINQHLYTILYIPITYQLLFQRISVSSDTIFKEPHIIVHKLCLLGIYFLNVLAPCIMFVSPFISQQLCTILCIPNNILVTAIMCYGVY